MLNIGLKRKSIPVIDLTCEQGDTQRPKLEAKEEVQIPIYRQKEIILMKVLCSILLLPEMLLSLIVEYQEPQCFYKEEFDVFSAIVKSEWSSLVSSYKKDEWSTSRCSQVAQAFAFKMKEHVGYMPEFFKTQEINFPLRCINQLFEIEKYAMPHDEYQRLAFATFLLKQIRKLSPKCSKTGHCRSTRRAWGDLKNENGKRDEGIPFLPPKTTLKNCSPTQILCYYLLWRGRRCADMTLDLFLPASFGLFFGVDGVIWLIYVNLLSCHLGNHLQLRYCQPVDEREVGYALEHALDALFPDTKRLNYFIYPPSVVQGVKIDFEAIRKDLIK